MCCLFPIQLIANEDRTGLAFCRSSRFAFVLNFFYAIRCYCTSISSCLPRQDFGWAPGSLRIQAFGNIGSSSWRLLGKDTKTGKDVARQPESRVPSPCFFHFATAEDLRIHKIHKFIVFQCTVTLQLAFGLVLVCSCLHLALCWCLIFGWGILIAVSQLSFTAVVALSCSILKHVSLYSLYVALVEEMRRMI